MLPVPCPVGHGIRIRAARSALLYRKPPPPPQLTPPPTPRTLHHTHTHTHSCRMDRFCRPPAAAECAASACLLLVAVDAAGEVLHPLPLAHRLMASSGCLPHIAQASRQLAAATAAASALAGRALLCCARGLKS